MKIDSVKVIYFSPTGGTRKLAMKLGTYIANELCVPMESLRLTLKEDREELHAFSATDLVVLATPTYADRVPNKIVPELEACLRFDGSPAIALVTYGNRSPGTSLEELSRILTSCGAVVTAGGSFVSRHAFTDEVGRGRPDRNDLEELKRFAKAAAGKLSSAEVEAIEFGPAGPYYTPLKEDGTPAVFLKAKPVLDEERCVWCRACRKACPMGSIDEDIKTVGGICIKCQACIRLCPVGARHFEDGDFLSHVRMLEQNYTDRKENKTYI